jgi:hypothetical protein
MDCPDEGQASLFDATGLLHVAQAMIAGSSRNPDNPASVGDERLIKVSPNGGHKVSSLLQQPPERVLRVAVSAAAARAAI